MARIVIEIEGEEGDTSIQRVLAALSGSQGVTITAGATQEAAAAPATGKGKAKAAAAPAPAPEPEPEKVPNPSGDDLMGGGEEETVTLDDVKAALSLVLEKKDATQAKAVLDTFGVGRVGDLKAEQYPEARDALNTLANSK